MKDLQELMMSLIRFPSTHDRNEEIHNCLNFIKEYMADTADIEMQHYERNSYPSTLFSRGTTTPAIILHGHIDVVGENGKDQYNPYIEGDRLYGRGSLDMKSGVAIGLYLLKNWQGTGPCPFGVLVTPDEEIGSAHGAQYIFEEQGLTCDMFITLEGDPKFALFHREKGMFCLRLTAEGTSGHASKPWLSENAIEKILDCIQELRPHFPNEKNAWSDTMAVTTLRGQSTGINVVPDKASAIIDIRFTGDREELASMIQETAKKHGCEASFQLSCPKVDTDISQGLGDSFVHSFKKIAGADAEVTFMHGASDARFPADKGILSFILGPQGEGHHGPTEWVSLESIKTVHDVLEDFIAHYSSTA